MELSETQTQLDLLHLPHLLSPATSSAFFPLGCLPRQRYQPLPPLPPVSWSEICRSKNIHPLYPNSFKKKKTSSTTWSSWEQTGWDVLSCQDGMFALLGSGKHLCCMLCPELAVNSAAKQFCIGLKLCSCIIFPAAGPDEFVSRAAWHSASQSI